MININKHKCEDACLHLKKRGKSKQMKRNKDITLIALVITIIILIILAAIAINAVFGENGLILRAQEAKFKTEVSGIKDLVDVKRLEIASSKYLNEPAGDLSAYLNGLNNLEYIGLNKLVIDSKKKLAYINEGNEGEFSTDQKQWLRDIGIYPAAVEEKLEWRCSFSTSGIFKNRRFGRV